MRAGAFAMPDRVLPLAVALVLILAAALAVRIGLQLRDLSTAHQEIAYREGLVRDYGARASGPAGTALLSGTPGDLPRDVAALVRRQAVAAGIKVTDVEVLDRRPGGTNLQVVRLSLRGSADAAGVDRLARWMERNGGSVVLERLIMATAQDGSQTAEFSADIAVLAAMTGKATGS